MPKVPVMRVVVRGQRRRRGGEDGAALLPERPRPGAARGGEVRRAALTAPTSRPLRRATILPRALSVVACGACAGTVRGDHRPPRLAGAVPAARRAPRHRPQTDRNRRRTGPGLPPSRWAAVALAYADCGGLRRARRVCARTACAGCRAALLRRVRGPVRCATCSTPNPALRVTDFLLRQLDRSVLAELGWTGTRSCARHFVTTPGWSGWRRSPSPPRPSRRRVAIACH